MGIGRSECIEACFRDARSSSSPRIVEADSAKERARLERTYGLLFSEPAVLLHERDELLEGNEPPFFAILRSPANSTRLYANSADDKPLLVLDDVVNELWLAKLVGGHPPMISEERAFVTIASCALPGAAPLRMAPP